MDAPRPRRVGYGLPCAKCHKYFPADLEVCPICKSRERVPAVVASAVLAVKVPVAAGQISAESTLDTTQLEQKAEELLEEFEAPAFTALDEIGDSAVPGNHHPRNGQSPVVTTLEEFQVFAEPLPDTAPLEQERGALLEEFTSPPFVPAEEKSSSAASSDRKDHHRTEDDAPTLPMLEEIPVSAEPMPDTAPLEQERGELPEQFQSPMLVTSAETANLPVLSQGDSQPVVDEIATVEDQVPTHPAPEASVESLPDTTSAEQEHVEREKEELPQETQSPTIEEQVQTSNLPALCDLEDPLPVEESFMVPMIEEVQASAAVPYITSIEQKPEEHPEEFKSAMLVVPEETGTSAASGDPDDYPPAEDAAPAAPTLAEAQVSTKSTPDIESAEQKSEELPQQLESPLFVAPEEISNSPFLGDRREQHPPEEKAPTASKPASDSQPQPANSCEVAPHIAPPKAAPPEQEPKLPARRRPKNRKRVSEPRLIAAPKAASPVKRPEEPDVVAPETPRNEPAVAYPSLASENSGRQFDVVTVVLGVVVLACAVLMSVVIGLHLSRYRAPADHTHKAKTANATVLRTQENTSSSNASPASLPAGAVGNSVSTDSSAVVGTSAATGAKVGSGPKAGAPVAPRNAKAAPATSVANSHPIHKSENEVARALPPAPAEKESAKPSEAQHSTVVWPARALTLSPDAAESSLLHRVEPDYPEEARRLGIQGPVVLDLHIGKDGTVQNVGLVSGNLFLSARQPWQ